MQVKFLNRLFLAQLGLICATMLGGELRASQMNELTFITESSASFNYIRDGKLQGPAVELLLAVTAQAGSPIERELILVKPWARGFKQALEGPNTVLFSTIRTPNRETKFQWVGPITSESDVLIALKSRQIKLTDSLDMRNYITGAVRGDVGEEILKEMGVPPGSIVLNSHSSNMGKMLELGRIDMWIFGEAGWKSSLISGGREPKFYEVVYRFPAKQYYFAVSRDVDKNVVHNLQAALDYVLANNPPNF